MFVYSSRSPEAGKFECVRKSDDVAAGVVAESPPEALPFPAADILFLSLSCLHFQDNPPCIGPSRICVFFVLPGQQKTLFLAHFQQYLDEIDLIL